MTENKPDTGERLDAVLAELKAAGETVEDYDHDDPMFAEQGEEGDMTAGDEGELP